MDMNLRNLWESAGSMFSRGVDFFKGDIWRIRSKNLPLRKYFLVKQLRIVLLAIRGFDENKCLLKASSLTFYSLLSIVPVAAMAFGIAKGFGFEKVLEKQLVENFPAQQEVVAKVIGFAQALLDNTKGGMIAGVGLVLLLWSVIKVLTHIESSFNEIWEIKESRTFLRKFSDYFSIMLISPIIMLLSGSVTVFITTQITVITEKIALLGFFSPLIFLSLKMMPYFLIWLLFTIGYILMPNTKVNFTSGLLAGVVAGTLYQISQWGYIYFQIGVAKYNAIYGSFAALPLFLVWLQLSWLIVLFGAEISFANQNVDTYEFEPDSLKVSAAFKRLLSLQVAHLLVKNFQNGEKPLTAEQISHNLEIPIRLVNTMLYELVESGVLSDARAGSYKELAYQPGRDINGLT
ncbi:MAG: YihY/virulence factor BrkB family protein, partial [Deltaproteobacteria bacterium]|nr:YihY/virulence factor BrkB family protein [Deltaproteobacteria bacterium]